MDPIWTQVFNMSTLEMGLCVSSAFRSKRAYFRSLFYAVFGHLFRMRATPNNPSKAIKTSCVFSFRAETATDFEFPFDSSAEGPDIGTAALDRKISRCHP